MKIALLCSGLGNIRRGHEVFAQDLYDLLAEDIDITLFKGGGEASTREIVVPNVPRNHSGIVDVKVLAAPTWVESVQEQERLNIEAETFAYAALAPLLAGEYDVIHCLERQVCDIIFSHRHFFKSPPKVIFSNGGAIPAWDLPQCDFVQEHSEHNLKYSAKGKAFCIPHGVDLRRFRPGIATDFRAEHGIPEQAFLVLSVGAVCYQHKRMDYVIKEVAALQDHYLAIVGQDTPDSLEIKALGERLMQGRVVFTSMNHQDLPKAYAAANVFVLGSLFETFGIVYVEALAMGLPVICTDHVNQRSIVKEGIFIDMAKQGNLTKTLQQLPKAELANLSQKSLVVAAKYYDLQVLKQQYIERYQHCIAVPSSLPVFGLKHKILANLHNLYLRGLELVLGRAE